MIVPSRPRTFATIREPARSLTDQAYARIRAGIVSCEMRPGLRVTEARLAAELNIGKTPVREALARLSQERLVRGIPRRGYEVTPVTVGDVQELFDVRLMLEPASAELAVGRADVNLLRRLDEKCARQAPARSEGPPGVDVLDRYFRANTEFHVALACASGNKRLAELIEGLFADSERVFHLTHLVGGHSGWLVHAHTAIVDAIAAGDRDAARHAVTQQLLEAQRLIMGTIVSSPAVLSARVAPIDGRVVRGLRAKT